MSNNEELVNLLFPPWKLMRSFLSVTIMLMLGTAFGLAISFNLYLKLTPEWEVGIIFLTGFAFCFTNFRVTRGSFFCAMLLKYYALLLTCVCIPALLIDTDYLFSFVTMLLMLFAFYLISGKTYQKFVQYQFDFFEDIKEAREAIKKELEMSHKSKRS